MKSGNFAEHNTVRDHEIQKVISHYADTSTLNINLKYINYFDE